MFGLIDGLTTCTFEQIDGRFAPSPFLHPPTSFVLARTPSHPLVCLRLPHILSTHTARFCTSIHHLVQHSFFISHFPPPVSSVSCLMAASTSLPTLLVWHAL
jgi:hypothetical protein